MRIYRPQVSSLPLAHNAEHCTSNNNNMYVCIYVRTFGHLRRRRRLDVYARARIQYRLGARRVRDSIYRVCHTERNFLIVSQLPRSLFDSGRNVTRVCVHMHACVRGVPRVCVCAMHARMRRLLEMVRTYVDVDHGRRGAKYARASASQMKWKVVHSEELFLQVKWIQ